MGSQQRATVTTIGHQARRRAGNALLTAAAALASLADDLEDLRNRSRLTRVERERLAALAAQELEARRQYQEALGRYRAVTSYAAAAS